MAQVFKCSSPSRVSTEFETRRTVDLNERNRKMQLVSLPCVVLCWVGLGWVGLGWNFATCFESRSSELVNFLNAIVESANHGV